MHQFFPIFQIYILNDNTNDELGITVLNFQVHYFHDLNHNDEQQLF